MLLTFDHNPPFTVSLGAARPSVDRDVFFGSLRIFSVVRSILMEPLISGSKAALESVVSRDTLTYLKETHFSLHVVLIKVFFVAMRAFTFFIATAVCDLFEKMGLLLVGQPLPVGIGVSLDKRHLVPEKKIGKEDLLEDVSLDTILQIFDQIDQTDPQVASVFQKKSLPNWKELRSSLLLFVERVKQKEPFIGTPPKNCKADLEKFYLTIEQELLFLLSSSIKEERALLLKQQDLSQDQEILGRSLKRVKEDRYRMISSLIEASSACGGRYASVVKELYLQKRGLGSGADLQETLFNALRELRVRLLWTAIEKHREKKREKMRERLKVFHIVNQLLPEIKGILGENSKFIQEMKSQHLLYQGGYITEAQFVDSFVRLSIPSMDQVDAHEYNQYLMMFGEDLGIVSRDSVIDVLAKDSLSDSDCQSIRQIFFTLYTESVIIETINQQAKESQSLREQIIAWVLSQRGGWTPNKKSSEEPLSAPLSSQSGGGDLQSQEAAIEILKKQHGNSWENYSKDLKQRLIDMHLSAKRAVSKPLSDEEDPKSEFLRGFGLDCIQQQGLSAKFMEWMLVSFHIFEPRRVFE